MVIGECKNKKKLYPDEKKKKVEENVLGKTQKYLKFRSKKKVKKSERQKTKFEKNSSQIPFFLGN